MKGVNSLTRLFGAVLVVGGISSAANAAIVLSDNFDGYANQAAFQAAWPAVGTTLDTTKQSAQLSSAQSVSPTNSVFVPISTTAATASTEYRNRRSFTEPGGISVSNALVWSFDFYDSITGNPQRNAANLQDTTAPSGTNQLVSMGLNNNQLSTASGGNYYMARILGYSLTATQPVPDPDGGPGETGTLGTSPYFKLNDFGVGLRSVGWHNLKVVIWSNDGASQDFDFYVDGVLAERVHNVGAVASLRNYDNILIGSGLTNGGATAYFDNMQLVTVPEPTSLAAIGLGAIALGSRRRRA